MLKFTEDLLSKGRRTIKLIVGLLTGHRRLNKQMSNIDPIDILCQCCRLGLERFGNPYIAKASFMKTTPPTL